MDKSHVVNLQGREYVTYEGLLGEAHKRGLRSIKTVLVQVPNQANDNTAIVTAEAVFDDGDGGVRVFTGIGDASPRNVGRNIIPHILRMAETRSKARALRDGTNIGMTAFEELEEAELPKEIGESKITQLEGRPAKPATRQQIDGIGREMKRAGVSQAQAREYFNRNFAGKVSRSELTVEEASNYLDHLKSQPAAEVSA